jgi:deoxycytidylate deaminase
MEVNNKKFWHQAFLEALKGSHSKFRHGAILVKNNKVISCGRNRDTFRQNRCIHAEEDAIKGCTKKQCIGATMFVVRIKADLTLGLSKPCKRCKIIIEKAKIERVFYS